MHKQPLVRTQMLSLRINAQHGDEASVIQHPPHTPRGSNIQRDETYRACVMPAILLPSFMLIILI